MNTHVPDPTKEFEGAGAPVTLADQHLLVRANAKKFLESISHFQTEADINTPDAKKFILLELAKFFIKCKFYDAVKDLHALVDFKSGERTFRSDGTYNIYHEIIPLINVLGLVVAGPENRGIDLMVLEQEGGLDVKIRTILNHDNPEDKPISKDQFYQELMAQTEQTIRQRALMEGHRHTEEQIDQERRITELVVRNVWTITNKTIVLDDAGQPIIFADGKYKRVSRFGEDHEGGFERFFRNIVNGEDSNVTSYVTKLGDIANNTATTTGSVKHDTEKKRNWVEKIIKLLGAEEALDQEALDKWPEHKNEIMYWDSHLGAVLYTLRSRIKYVEHGYPDEQGAFGPNSPEENIVKQGVGSKYLENILHFNEFIPRFARGFYTMIDRERELAETDQKVKVWLERGMYPALKRYKKHFPEIFGGPEELAPASISSAPPVRPAQAVCAPAFL